MFSKVRLARRKVSLVILVMLFILLLCPSVTSAYTLWGGYKWDSVDPLYYLIENYVGYRTRAAFSGSICDWNIAGTPANFQYSAAEHKVYLYEVFRNDVNWDGMTTRTLSGWWWWRKVVYANACLNAVFTDDYGLNERKSVSGHELGHVLQLWEMDWDDPVLMNQFTDWRFGVWGVFTPQQDDIDGVNDLYG
jgi:hypothetical protein